MSKYNKPEDAKTAFLIYTEAAAIIRKKGYPIPKFSEKDIKEKNDFFCLELDLDQKEEKIFGRSFVKLSETYYDLIGIENKKLPKTFTVILGENFHKKPVIPTWEEQPENGQESTSKEQDIYNTYEENPTQPLKKQIKESKKQNEKDPFGTYESFVDL